MSGPTVVGEVTNTTGSGLDYLEAVARFRGENHIHGSAFTNVTNFAADDTWRFELEFLTLAPEPPQITEYDLRFRT